MSQIILYILLAFLGAALGSFCLSFAHRFCEQKALFTRRSFCFFCGEKLRFFELIPIFSYIFLRGKCAQCQAKLSLEFLIIEILGACLSIFAFLIDPFLLNYFILLLLFFNLFLLSLIDIRLRSVPAFLLWTAYFLAFFYVLCGDHNFDYLIIINIFTDDIVLKIFYFILHSCLFAGAIFLLKDFIVFVKNKDEQNLGEADLIIIALIGGVLGIREGIFAILLASILALPFFTKIRFLPFLPFLSFGFFLLLLFEKLSK